MPNSPHSPAPAAAPGRAAPPKPSLQKLFLTGLLTLLPIWLTWVVVKFVFVMLSDISAPLIGPLLQNVADSYRQLA